MVMLLPHGYEGSGPEHSSARLERFLQLAAGNNICVVNCTTAAQYYHLLRRQAASLETAPRPLIVMSPKVLLRHPMAASSLPDLATGSFQPVLDDASVNGRAKSVTRVILCSGKVYVDLVSHKGYQAAERVATVRLEQLYPFSGAELKQILKTYSSLKEVVWLQEEPKNMGGWSFVEPYLRDLLGPEIKLQYVGRVASASPAEGSARRHSVEQNRIVTAAISDVPNVK
jgi:2-oxoglutarate dehydrogenase E1 component